MVTSIFNQPSIVGVSTILGQLSENIDDLADLYADEPDKLEKLKKAIGLKNLCRADQNTTSLDLCLQAAKRLISSMDINTQEIDAVVFVTQTPDYSLPGNSSLIHRDLGLSTNCACIDLSQGCSGYIYGLWITFMLLESSNSRNVLLLAGDTMSHKVNPKDKSCRPLFGDSGTATYIVSQPANHESYFSLNTDGSGYDSIIIPSSGFRKPEKTISNLSLSTNDPRNSSNLYMDGIKVFNFALKRAPESINDILSFAHLTIADIDYFFLHQANKYVIEKICKKANIPFSKAPSDTVGKYGNQGPSSIPSTICDFFTQNKVVNDATILMCGFGVGLSWASAIVKIPSLVVLPPVQYVHE